MCSDYAVLTAGPHDSQHLSWSDQPGHIVQDALLLAGHLHAPEDQLQGTEAVLRHALAQRTAPEPAIKRKELFGGYYLRKLIFDILLWKKNIFLWRVNLDILIELKGFRYY